MKTNQIKHYAGEKSEPLQMEERVCRPGASFGPKNTEYSMGVRSVFHLNAVASQGRISCATCGGRYDIEVD